MNQGRSNSLSDVHQHGHLTLGDQAIEFRGANADVAGGLVAAHTAGRVMATGKPLSESSQVASMQSQVPILHQDTRRE